MVSRQLAAVSGKTMTGEFDIIRQYFSTGFPEDDGVIKGVGDDGAVLRPGTGKELVMSCDTLVSGVHFPASDFCDPADIGYRCLAVNLSDLAAMGATPRWFMLALTMPAPNAQWLEGFAEGLASCARSANIALVGGDTTRGPLSITIQVVGELPEGEALLRSGANPGDAVFVSGKLGAAAAYVSDRADSAEAASAFWRPQAQLRLGQALRGVASSAIDISDGLICDLGHILDASGVGATLHIDRLPLADLFSGADNSKAGFELAASGGDDYQLCFTVPADRVAELEVIGSETETTITQVGSCVDTAGLELLFNGKTFEPQHRGYQHFAGAAHE